VTPCAIEVCGLGTGKILAVRNDRIYGRACDDLVGVAAILAVMSDQTQEGPGKRDRVISRAERLGFVARWP